MFKNEEIIYVKKEGIEYIQFKRLLKYGIKHAYTLKSDGVNFAFNQPKHDESYSNLCKALDIDVKTVIEPVQTHTDIVKCVDSMLSTEETQNVDGLITNKCGVTLTSKNADCILFLFYDPVKKVIANVHSGWRGTFKKIAEKTVCKMINYYGSKAEDIICCICPSIRKCHFEVSLDVKELCEEIFEFTGKIDEFIELGNIVDGEQKYNIDTVMINKILLKELGIKERNIVDSNLCSMCNPDKIESVRVDKGKSGRATAIITL
jgi:hypothetical protein